MSLQIQCSRSGEQAVLDLEGQLDSGSSAQLITRVLDLINTGCSDIWLSFETVSAVSAEGIEALAAMDGALPAGASLRVSCAPGALRRDLSLAGLEHVISSGDPGKHELDLFGLTASAGGRAALGGSFSPHEKVSPVTSGR